MLIRESKRNNMTATKIGAAKTPFLKTDAPIETVKSEINKSAPTTPGWLANQLIKHLLPIVKT